MAYKSSSVEELLASRKGAASDAMAKLQENADVAEGKKAQKRKETIQLGGTAIGTVVGAYFANPALGASIGSAAGAAVGGMATGSKEKQIAAAKRAGALDDSSAMASLGGLINTFAKFAPTGGTDYSKMSDIEITDMLQKTPDVGQTEDFLKYMKTRSTPLPAFPTA